MNACTRRRVRVNCASSQRRVASSRSTVKEVVSAVSEEPADE